MQWGIHDGRVNSEMEIMQYPAVATKILALPFPVYFGKITSEPRARSMPEKGKKG